MPSSQFGKWDGIIENPHPSLKAILLKVSTISLNSDPGVGELAPEMLDRQLLSVCWMILTMDCAG